jgi:hypothetical protein
LPPPRGVAGIVTDGGFRDSPDIAKLTIPAYWSTNIPAPSSRKLADVGISVPGGPPEAFAEYIQVETAKWSKVAKDAGITADE